MEGIVVSLAGNALRFLIPVLQEKVSSLVWVQENAQFISDELESMNAFLTKITAARQANDPEFQVWASQVRDLAYDIEDWAEEFNWYLSRQHHWRRHSSTTGNLFRSFIAFHKNLGERLKIANDVLQLKSRVLAVSERSQRYGLGRTFTQEAITSCYDPRFAAHFIDDDQLVGIEKPRDALIKLLISEDDAGLSVVSVTGMGGLGKTTLVKKVYDSPEMIEHFQSYRLWVTISQSFELKVILRDIIEQLSFLQVINEDQLNQEQLLQTLKELNEDQSARKAVGDANGEQLVHRIRVDLRHRRNDRYVYRIKPLSSQESRHLFSSKVFPHLNNNNSICPPELEDLSERIISKCAGLPLAIVTIAGVLASKGLVQSEWQKLFDHLGSSMESNPSLDRMRRILAYSYENLPCHLKLCFLYLSIFPKDYPIRRKRLLRRWMAEGLVRATRDMSSEDAAECYFEELVNRSLILPSLVDGNGTVLICRVHDIMLEFIISVSIKENLVSIINERHEKLPQSILRHLSVHQHAPMCGKNLARVRSLTVFVDQRKSFVDTRMRLLRVLDLEGCQLIDQELQNIGEFSLLKYLSLRNTQIEVVPKSFGKLRNLETLDLKWTQVSSFPLQLSKLHQLHYLHA